MTEERIPDSKKVEAMPQVIVPPRGLSLLGEFTFEVFEEYDRKTGEGKIVHHEIVRNGITTDGITDLFEQYFRAGTGTTPAVGLIDDASFVAVAVGDTMASHADWIEVTDYSEATRPTWSPDAATSSQISNSVKVLFTMTAAKDVKGLFITTDDTKGGTAGKLWCTAIFDLVVSLQSGQVARAGYTLVGAGA